ncbi:MAG TPA: M23 family metallopeptidase [Candidatus Hydrogenedentes bacterium]|nr:M23 family metallopeptidase [Candidatus Hydrogenedentota bacterium]
MKRWTVVLIPQHRGEHATHTITLASAHLWLMAGVLVLLTFLTAFYYERQRLLLHREMVLRQVNRALELESAKSPENTPSNNGPQRDEVRAIEARLKAEYEASIAAITAQLNDLYEMEKKARDLTGLQAAPAGGAGNANRDGKGKGGAISLSLAAMPVLISGTVTPPTLLETGTRPSADLLIQEIRLRRESLALLIRDVERQKEKVERIPAGWPLARRIGKYSSPFGYRLDPFTRRLDMHEGQDISAPYGTPVVATARGVVRLAGYKDAYGNMVIIDHGDGIQTAYAHLSAILVKPGDKVSRGQVIGKVGSTGRSTGNHLHYEVRLNNSPVNPMRYIAR